MDRDDSSEPVDRSAYPTRKARLHDAQDDAYVLSLTPAERMELVWQLTVQAWEFKEGRPIDPRVRRDVVRVVRGAS
jgi:hypothetical protein